MADTGYGTVIKCLRTIQLIKNLLFKTKKQVWFQFKMTSFFDDIFFAVSLTPSAVDAAKIIKTNTAN